MTTTKMLFWFFIFITSILIGLFGLILIFNEDITQVNWKLLRVIFFIHGFIVAFYALYSVFNVPIEEYEKRRYKRFDLKTMKIE